MLSDYSWSRLDHGSHGGSATTVSWGIHLQRIILYKILFMSFPPDTRVGYGAAFSTNFLFLHFKFSMKELAGFAGTGLKPGVLYMLDKSSIQVTTSWPILFMLRRYNSHFYFREKMLNFHQSYFHFSPWMDSFTFVYSPIWMEERQRWDFSVWLILLTFYPVISVVVIVITQRTRANSRHLAMEWPEQWCPRPDQTQFLLHQSQNSLHIHLGREKEPAGHSPLCVCSKERRNCVVCK